MGANDASQMKECAETAEFRRHRAIISRVHLAGAADTSVSYARRSKNAAQFKREIEFDRRRPANSLNKSSTQLWINS